MHLPCPSCGTVYDIDLAVYVPGTVFECVRCQTRVTVPASVADPEPESPAPTQETLANPIDETDELVDALEELPLAEDDLLEMDEDVDFSELNESEPAAALGRIEPEKRPAEPEPEVPTSVTTDVQVDTDNTALSFLEANDAVPASDDSKLELDLTPPESRELPPLDLDFDPLPPLEDETPPSETASDDEVDIFAVSPELELPTLDFDDPPADTAPEEEEDFDPFALPEDPVVSTSEAPVTSEASAPASDLELSASLELPDLPDLMDALTDDSFVGVNPTAASNVSNPLFDSGKWESPETSAAESIQADLQDTPPPAPQATIPPLPDPNLSAPPSPQGQSSAPKSSSGLFLLALVATGAALAYVYFYTDFLEPTSTPVQKQVEKTQTAPVPKSDATETKAVAQPTTEKTPATPKEAEVPKAETPTQSGASLTITNENIDHLSFKELTSGVKGIGKAQTQDAESKALTTWAHVRLAYSFGHEDSKEMLQKNADSAVKFLTEAGRNPKASSLEMAAALGTLAVANPKSDLDPNLLRSNALRRKGMDGSRYAYALALTLPKGKHHNSRFIGLLDRAIALQPIFPDAVVAKAAHLFDRNRITAGVRTIQAFAQKDAPNESLIRLSKILLRRKLYSALSPIAEKIKLTTIDESLAPGLVGTFLQIQTYRDILKGDIAQLIEDTTVAVQKKSKNLSQVIRLVRLQAIANQDAQSTIQTRRGDFDGADESQLDYEGIRLELQKSPTNLEEAQKKLESFKKNAPKKGSGWVWIATGDLAFARGSYKNAVKHYQKARKADENLSIALLLTELAQAKGEKRLPNLTRLTKLAKSSKLTAVNYAMAQTMEAKNNVAGAQSLYEMTMWTNPVVGSPLELVSQFAWVTFQTGDAQRALRIAKQFHEMNPSFAPMVKVLIKMAINARDKKAIAQWYTILDGIEPFNKNHSVELAKAWLNLNNPQKARAVLARLLSEKPQERNAEVTKQLARTWAEDDDAKCRSLLFESIRYKPSPDTYILLAELEVRRQSRNNAIDAYREALKIAPGQVSVRFSLIELLLADGKLEESIRELNSVTSQNPNLSRANVLLGDTYRELGKPKEAVAHYYLALRSSKQTEELLLKTARLELYELNQIKHAVENFERVLQINPKNAEAHYRLGFALKDLDQLERAKAEFNTYLELAADGEFAKEVQGELLNLKD